VGEALPGNLWLHQATAINNRFSNKIFSEYDTVILCGRYYGEGNTGRVGFTHPCYIPPLQGWLFHYMKTSSLKIEH